MLLRISIQSLSIKDRVTQPYSVWMFIRPDDVTEYIVNLWVTGQREVTHFDSIKHMTGIG